MEGSSDIAFVPSTHSMDTVCAKGLFTLCNQRRNFSQALIQEVAEQRPELSSSHHLPTDPHPSAGLSPWWWWTHPQSLLGIRMGSEGQRLPSLHFSPAAPTPGWAPIFLSALMAPPIIPQPQPWGPVVHPASLPDSHPPWEKSSATAGDLGPSGDCGLSWFLEVPGLEPGGGPGQAASGLFFWSA